jgi:hypothetical protein
VANHSALLPVQGAIYDTLTSDVELMGLAGVYDNVPENVAYPYVVIGEGVETPSNNHGDFGSRVSATLHVFSEYRGYAQANAIVNRLMTLLDHNYGIVISGRNLVAIRHEQTVLTSNNDSDPDVRHAVVRFTFETFDA